jgi:hypothetical protein
MSDDERAALRALARESLVAGDAYDNAPISASADDLIRLQGAASDADGKLSDAALSIIQALDALDAAQAERDTLAALLRDLVQLEADGRTEYESSIENWERARAALAALEAK